MEVVDYDGGDVYVLVAASMSNKASLLSIGLEEEYLAGMINDSDPDDLAYDIAIPAFDKFKAAWWDGKRFWTQEQINADASEEDCIKWLSILYGIDPVSGITYHSEEDAENGTSAVKATRHGPVWPEEVRTLRRADRQQLRALLSLRRRAGSRREAGRSKLSTEASSDCKGGCGYISYSQ